MSRQARKESSTGLYHIMTRGAGKQILFEEDKDYRYFIRKVADCRKKMDFEVIAYCLMNNHVHLLIKTDSVETMSSLMLKLESSYAGFYNKKYDHSGHVFQGRYLSVTIENETSLLRCTRYIHNNPVKAKFGRLEEYPWSSYNDYISREGITDVGLVLSIIEGVDNFKEFSKGADDYKDGMSDVEDTVTLKVGNEIIKEYLENQFEIGTVVKKLNYDERNDVIRKLKTSGLSNRQIELLTGVSREIIKKIK